MSLSGVHLRKSWKFGILGTPADPTNEILFTTPEPENSEVAWMDRHCRSSFERLQIISVTLTPLFSFDDKLPWMNCACDVLF